MVRAICLFARRSGTNGNSTMVRRPTALAVPRSGTVAGLSFTELWRQSMKRMDFSAQSIFEG